MTIEASSNQGVNRSPAASESKGASNKQSNASDVSSKGFMAVLASVETPAPAQEPAADTAATLPQGKSTGGKNQIKAKTTASADAKKPDPATPKGASAEDINGTTLADDAQVLADPSAAAAAAALNLLSATDPAAADVPMSGAALLAQSITWGSIAKGEVDSEGGLVPTTGPTVGLVTGTTGARSAAGASALGGATTLAEMSTEQLAGGVLKTIKGQAEAKSKPLLATVAANAAVTSDSKNTTAVNQKLADIHSAPLTTAIAIANASTNVGVGMIASLLREEPSRERSVFRANSAEGAFSPQAISTPAPTLTVSGAPEVIATTDAFVADKVSYWISNNIQNAEMKLDGVGDHPVEVSIRMQGNEAHVAFRTDELQTRAALEHASVHLKDLLQREGLVLSGVSVGTAGTGDSGPQDRKSRQGEQQAIVTTLQPLGGDLGSVSNRVTSGGLDLFV